MTRSIQLQPNKRTVFDRNTPSTKNDGKSYSELGNFRELSSGAGSSIFKANAEGVFAGANTYTSAPFRLSYTGNLYATAGTIAGNFTISGSLNVTGNITLGTGGYINRGKTSFDSTAAGFWLDNRFHIGSSASKYFKYDGTDISMLGGTITGGTIQTATTGYRTVLSSSNLQFYNGTTQKGFLRPDSDASMVLGTADDLWITDTSGSPIFKLTSGGDIQLRKADAQITFESSRYIKDRGSFLGVDGDLHADHLASVNDVTDEFYVATSSGGSPTHKITVIQGIVSNSTI